MVRDDARGRGQRPHSLPDGIGRDAEPIEGCRPATPTGAGRTLEEEREPLVNQETEEARRDIVARIRQLKFRSPTSGTTLDLLRKLRS